MQIDQLIQPLIVKNSLTELSKKNPVETNAFAAVLGAEQAHIEETDSVVSLNVQTVNPPTLNPSDLFFRNLLQSAPVVEPLNPAIARGIATTPVYEFKNEMSFTISDTNSHDVLSSRLSAHSEPVKVSFRPGSYSASQIADQINSAIASQRATRRVDITASSEDGRVFLNTSETGDTSEISLEGNEEFARFFGSSRLKVNGSGGEKAFATSENRLADGRQVSSGGNRVALRYWSSDGQYNDHKIMTPEISDREFLSGDEILKLYNEAFSEQIGGAVVARYNDAGQMVFESAEGGTDNGFRLIRLPGNFSVGMNQSNSGYATLGKGGTSARLELQTPDSPSQITIQDRLQFRVADTDGNRSHWIMLGEEGKSTSYSKQSLFSLIEKANLNNTLVEFGLNQLNQLEFRSKNPGSDYGFTLQTPNHKMNSRLFSELGFLADVLNLGTGHPESEKADTKPKPRKNAA
ncbi:MAG: hypothetical protein H3C47_03675 [Candidatus Cloacimonetes bacterium]|nr:hypothetical protein [Candidatus Cloacimonadota bacterium]